MPDVGVTYDTGALIAADRGDRRMWLMHERANARGVRPTVPAGVIVEAYRSPRQRTLLRLLQGCRIESLTETTAQGAGALLGLCAVGGVEAVDATCVEGALRRGDAVVTSNRTHLAALADRAGRTLDLIPV